jgi:CheY-like chemotaxis protein
VICGDYELVLMDVQMPVVDGLSPTWAIRALAGDVARTPIIALTANVLADHVAFYRAQGMDDHVGSR